MEMEKTLGIDPESPGICDLFESPSDGNRIQRTITRPHNQTETRGPRRSVRRTTMLPHQLNQSLRQSEIGLMPPPKIPMQPPR